MDAIDLFLQTYLLGETATAVQKLFPSEGVCLDTYGSEPEKQLIVNFADSLAFGNMTEALVANFALMEHLENSRDSLDRLRKDHLIFKLLSIRPDQVRDYLTTEPTHYLPKSWLTSLISENKRLLLSNETKENLAQESAELALQIQYGQNVVSFERLCPRFYQFLVDCEPYLSRSAYPLQYPLENAEGNPLIQAREEGKIPVIFMQPYRLNWKQFLAPISDYPAIFLFPQPHVLFHCLYFTDVKNSLVDRKHMNFVLGIYPNGQLTSQPVYRSFDSPLKAVILGKQDPLQESVQPCLDGLNSIFRQTIMEVRGETSVANSFYQFGSAVRYALMCRRTGFKRFPAFYQMRDSLKWHDPKKGPSSRQFPKPKLPYTLQEYLATLKPIDRKRSYPSRGKIRLAHIVPQLVDTGHAPTKLLKTLLLESRQDLFHIQVYCTERMVFRSSEYPYDPFSSQPSPHRAKKTLQQLKDWSIDCYVDDGKKNFLETAWNLASWLRNQNIDIAVFHGPDVINCQASTFSDVPLKVMFEHGTLPDNGAFDLIIASSDASSTKHREYYESLGCKIKGFGFAYDARQYWDVLPPKKSDWSLPEDAKILTTISNNLETRVSKEMVWAICHVLQRCPLAYYMPMGRLDDRDAFIFRFEKYGVQDRIKPLGQVSSPSQMARSMHLYVNEFPFGSGLAILDAMASGLPVVSMHDEAGRPQAKYGAAFFGKEQVITSCKKEDYAQLTYELLTDDDKYQEWSKLAFERYEEHCSTKIYVEKIEELFLSLIHSSCQTSNANT